LETEKDFDVEIVSTIEANLTTIDGKKNNILATGSYSDLEVLVMWGLTKNGKNRSHFGLILKQEKEWKINYKKRKCMLFHHMNDRIEIKVGCVHCLRNCVRDAYGKTEVPYPKVKWYDYGRSTAAVGRFFGEESLKRNVGYKYSYNYSEDIKEDNAFYEWKQTNCLRLVFDMLFFLKLDFELAKEFVVDSVGNEKWRKVFETLVEEYPTFLNSMTAMWTDMKENKELKKVCDLMNRQYKLDEGMLNLAAMALAKGIISFIESLLGKK